MPASEQMPARSDPIAKHLRPVETVPALPGRAVSFWGRPFGGSQAHTEGLGDRDGDSEWIATEAHIIQVMSHFRCGPNQLPHIGLPFQLNGGWFLLVMVRDLADWDIRGWFLSVGGFDL